MPYDQSAGENPITGWARRSQRRRHADDEHERQKHPPPHFACDPNLSSLLAQADGLHPEPACNETQVGRASFGNAGTPGLGYRAGKPKSPRSEATRAGVCDLGAGARAVAEATACGQ